MNTTKNKKLQTEVRLIIGSSILFISIFILAFGSLNFVSGQEVKYCCEKTTYGAWCQDAPKEQCDSKYRSTPTSCEATSFCKLGCCYNSNEGNCMENTPQKVCDDSKGTWGDDKQCDIPQCNLGCCVLGKQAAFVTLTRCKKLSSFYGLTTDFRKQITSEFECISLASLEDEGACVFELDYGKTCKFTSRQECNSMKEGTKTGNGTITGNISFYKDYLCSNEELATNCGPTKKTNCVDSKDEVYFLDSCGNIANIYDSSKIDDKSYWAKKISKAEICNANNANGNANYASCGNCDYFSGSVCGSDKNAKTKPTYGDSICRDLNCYKTDDGKPRKHGESWCSTDKNKNAVGSRYIRHLCMNGEEIIEPCSDFRQEICIEDKIVSKGIEFSQAGCRVNRWQDCLSQKDISDCKNTDKRDCKWVGGETNPCVPENPPGLKFWEAGEAQGVCSKANTECTATFTKEKKGLIFKRDGNEEVGNEYCLSGSWQNEQEQKCQALGDCGSKINYLGVKGYKPSAKTTKSEETKTNEEKKGGLFG